jgi:hypothetical protein
LRAPLPEGAWKVRMRREAGTLVLTLTLVLSGRMNMSMAASLPAT